MKRQKNDAADAEAIVVAPENGSSTNAPNWSTRSGRASMNTDMRFRRGFTRSNGSKRF